MLIALPTQNNSIDDHFGHCEYFTIVEVENNTIVSKRRFDSPQGCGCKSGVAPLLANEGVTLMLAGNMGQGALNVLSANGIEVIKGCSGTIDAVVNAYLADALVNDPLTCNHHDCH